MHSGRSLRVCALVPYPPGTVPGQRFRIEQWMPHLEASGIDVDLRPFADPKLARMLYAPGRYLAKAALLTVGLIRRLREVASLASCDLVLVYRAAVLFGPALLERWVRRLKPLVLDFDDAIYLVDVSPANRRFGWLKFAGKTTTLCRISASVVVGNSYLAEFALRHNSTVTVVPSSIDTGWYRPATDRRSTSLRPVIGWMGSSTSQVYLEQFAPVLRRIAGRHNIELRVISDRRPNLEGLPVAWRPWTAESEPAEIAEFDIGIMPIPDTPWTRGKCAMKALQYMGMAVPAVGSRVGTNAQVIRHGDNGLLAATDDEWVTAIESLLGDPELRRRLGQAGRATVEHRYSAAVCAAGFADALRRAL
jgi:glycosyltransferase involved in cell wall biosynthesis